MRMVGRDFMAEIEDRKAGLTSRIVIESGETVVVLASTRLEISGGTELDDVEELWEHG